MYNGNMDIEKTDEYGLTVKKRKFVQEYLIDLDAKAAAERAGYEPIYGMALMSRDDVTTAISEISEQMMEKNHMEIDEAITQLDNIARTSIDDVYDHEEGKFKIKERLTKRALGSIKEIKTNKDGTQDIKLHDRKEALKDVVRRRGGYVQKHEHEVNITHSEGDVEQLISRMEQILEAKKVQAEIIDVEANEDVSENTSG